MKMKVYGGRRITEIEIPKSYIAFRAGWEL